MRRIVVLSLAALFVLLLALPAPAQEEGEEPGETTTTQVDARTPAVVVEPPPPAEVQEPWTSRYLVPTGLLLAAVAVFATVVQYFLRVVRTRYKVVE